MATRKKSPARKALKVATFKQPMDVEIIAPVIVPFAALKAMDLQKLGKGSHTIEVGTLHGGCCPKLVRAAVRNGLVTRLDVEPCDESEQVRIKDMPKDVVAAITKARRKIGNKGWAPVPVSEFITTMARQNDDHYPPRAGTGAGCFYICIWHYCVFCCWWDWPTFCWVERRKPDVWM